MKFQDWWGNKHTLPKGTSFSWRPSVYGLIIRRNELLLVQAAMHGLWELPGGAIELQESIHQALRREVLEETGYRVMVTNQRPVYFDSVYFFAPDTHQFYKTMLVVLEARLAGKSKRVGSIANPEVSKCAWFPISKLPKNVQPMTRKAVRAYLARFL